MDNFIFDIGNRKSIIQLFRYGLIGIVSNLTDFMVDLLLTYLGAEPKTTMSIVYRVRAAVGGRAESVNENNFKAVDDFSDEIDATQFNVQERTCRPIRGRKWNKFHSIYVLRQS